MLSTIRKITTSFLAKVLIVIIILPFLFWGMGDVFRGGNQNILATIDSEKISVTNFVNYVGRLNLNEQQRNSLNKTDLLEENKVKEIMKNFSKNKDCEVIALSTLEKASVSKIKAKLLSYVS